MEELKKESAKFQKKLAADEANEKSKKILAKEAADRLKFQKKRESLLNPWSGNVHWENGKKEFWDGSGEIGGVNDWLQVHHKKHHHH